MRNMKKILSFLLVLSMVLSYVPMPTLAAENGLCAHHVKHDEDCGYVAKVEGKDCTHQCNDDCGERSACTHSCETDGCPWVDAVAQVDCDHRCDGTNCAWRAAVPEVKCTCGAEPAHTAECASLAEEGAECNCGMPTIHTEGCAPQSAVDEVTCDHDCANGGCSYAAAVEAHYDCQHTHGDSCVEKYCAHTHDKSCSYVEKAEGKDCKFVCEICNPPVDEAVEAVKTQINTLPTVEEVSAMTYEEKIALHNGAYLTAGNAYNALTEEQKAKVDPAKLMALAAYFADPSNLQILEEHTCNNITWTGITSVGKSLSNGNYYLQNDITCANDVTISGTVNLCLNGNKLIWNGTQRKITINSGATLNIYDCGGNGTCSLVIVNNGTLNIYGGKYGGRYIVNGGTNYTQLINNKGTLHIHNATVEADIAAINNEGTLTIDNGSFKIASTWTNVWCIDNASGTAVINGGSFTSSSSHTIYSNGSSSSLTIEDGTFSNTGEKSFVLYVTHGTCTIKGGTFNASNNVTIKASAPGSSKTVIAGGNFYSKAGKNIISGGSKDTIEISGGIFKTEGGIAKVSASDGCVSGGTFMNGISLSNLEDKLAEGYAYYQNGEKVTLTENVGPFGTTKQSKIEGGNVKVEKIASTYTVTVTADPTEGGTVTTSHTSAAEGAEVSLTAEPYEGYQFKEWQVVSQNVTIADNKFTMPASHVEIKAIFEEIGKYSVWVQGVQITETNKDNVLADEGKTVSYDTVTNTLTLNGANITGASANSSTATYGIWSDSALNIAVGDKGAAISGGNYGIEAGPSLNISGGQLTVSNVEIIGVKAASITINCANLSVASNGHAICATSQGAISINGTVTANGGTSGSGYMYGLAGGSITLGNNSHVIASGGTAAAEVTPTLASGASGVSRTSESGEFVSNIVYGNEKYFEFKSAVPVTGVTLSESTLSLSVGETKGLTATVFPDNATNKEVTWSSSNTDVATVSTEGVITAASAGETVITVTTEDGEYKASCTVKVVAEFPVWVQGIRITSENMADVLGDGTVSYDPATFTLTLNNAQISSTESGASIHSLYPEYTLKIVGTGTNTISTSGGSGIYANNQNISISGGTFLISGSTNGIYAENGSVTIGNAQVKAVGTAGHGVFAKEQLSVTNGGLLSVSGNNAVVRGSYTMSDGTIAELGVAENAVLTIASGATVTVTEKITSSGTIQINGTLKVPAGSGRNTMSGGILYIGDKGYQWDTEDEVYYCLDGKHDWTYTASDTNSDDVMDTITASCECGASGGSLKITAANGTYNGNAHTATLTPTDWKGAEVTPAYGYNATEADNYSAVNETKNAGYYKASVTLENADSDEATAYVEYTVSPKSLTADGITAELSDTVIFEGQPVPTVTVKDGNTTLTKDTDYTVSQTGSNGEFTLTITGKGNYKDAYDGTLTYLVVTLPDPDKVEPDDKDAIDAYDRYSELNETYKDAELTKALEELQKALTDYEIIKGHKSSYTKGSYKTLSFTANGYFGKFTGVEVNGKLIDAKYYTAESGSTVITLKSSYLETLKTGKHYIQVNYTDGDTGGEEYFRVTVNNGSPFTGDDSHMMLFTGMALTSLLCMAMFVMFYPRKKGKYQR